MQPKPAELSMTKQYPACDHPDELLTCIDQIELASRYVGGYKRTETAELYHCAKCGRIINLGSSDSQEVTGDQLYAIFDRQRKDVIDALDEIDAQSRAARKTLEV